jgi:uncharacterized membrane protein
VPAAEEFEAAVDADVRIGFERTIEQDVAFSIRQQIDIGCKALSPAVNDPYTAVQAIDHLAVVCCDLAVRPLGTKIITGPEGSGRVVIPGNNFADYIFFIGGLFGRYGSSDLVVMLALLRLFEKVVEVLPPGSPRLAVMERATVEALAERRALNTTPAESGANPSSGQVATQQDQLPPPGETHLCCLTTDWAATRQA